MEDCGNSIAEASDTSEASKESGSVDRVPFHESTSHLQSIAASPGNWKPASRALDAGLTTSWRGHLGGTRGRQWDSHSTATGRPYPTSTPGRDESGSLWTSSGSGSRKYRGSNGQADQASEATLSPFGE